MAKMKRIEFDSEDKESLSYKILNDIKASEDLGLLRCVQCGLCTSMCPASRHSDYDARELIKRVLDDDKTIIDDDIIWNCFYCYTCYSVCPVGNSVCEVNQIIRQMAIDEDVGKQHIKSFISFADSYMDKGLGIIPQEYLKQLSEDYGQHWDNLQEQLEEVREYLGLESMYLLPEAEKSVDKTLEAIGFKNRVQEIKNVKDKE